MKALRGFESHPIRHDQLKESSISLSNKLAIEFTILTACRTNEVLKANWNEINLEDKIWIIPKERMKALREHMVPYLIEL